MAAKPTVFARKRVLLLEDDRELTSILRELFQSHGCDTVAVRDGVEGLKRVMAEEFDVILCDMLMPNLPGDMFYLAVERTRPHLCPRFIFMTGYKGDPKLDEFLRRHKSLVIYKPFHLDDLMNQVGRLLGGAREKN